MADGVDPVDDPVDDDPVDDYAIGVSALSALVAKLPAHPPVTHGRMFNGDGVKVHGKMFAFIGRNGDLVAKLPHDRVRDLVARRSGDPVVMGVRTMREWVRLSAEAEAEAEAGAGAWSEVLFEAYSFALTRPNG
ncbi:hypothetical protein [Cryobacterium sp. W22_MBD10_FK3]|uniref:hypothetical protein n=1 Tax=Cryobacterium sp. W22_MBD10_FK3 TaxID=3240273 RepID=UPI003F903073